MTSPEASSPGRTRRITLVLVLVVAAVAALTWAVLSMRDDGDPAGGATTTASATDSSSPSPEPSPEEAVDPAIFERTPAEAWTTSAADLMAGEESGVAVAAADPAGRPNIAQVVVLAAWGDDSSAAIGLDRATGAEVWRVDLPGVRQVACHVLGDGRRTACTVPVAEESDEHRVVTLDTATGEILGDDTVAQTPRHVVAVGDDLLVAGSNVADGRLMMSRGTPDDVDRIWSEESDPGFVDATEYWGTYTTDEGRAAVEVSGSSMLVELATGDARLGRSDGDGLLGLWPAGATTRTTVERQDDSDEGTATTTLTRPDGTELTIPGVPWGRLGTSDVMTDVVGAGDTAYDALTAAPLWTTPERADVLTTGYLMVDDLLLQISWYEESAQMLALDARTGDTAWTASSRSYARSAVHGRVLVLGSYWELTAIDLETGESPWQLSYESDMAGDDSYWSHTVEHTVVGDALVTVSYDTVRGYTFP